MMKSELIIFFNNFMNYLDNFLLKLQTSLKLTYYIIQKNLYSTKKKLAGAELLKVLKKIRFYEY